MDEVARVPQMRTRRRSDRACVGLDGAKEQGQVGPLDALYCFRVPRYLQSCPLFWRTTHRHELELYITSCGDCFSAVRRANTGFGKCGYKICVLKSICKDI